MILVQNQIRDMIGGETGKITFGRIKYNFGFRAIRIPLCVQHNGTLKGYRLQGCWYYVDDSVCRAEGFGLFLAKGCDCIAALTLCKQKHPLKLPAYINWTAVYARSGMRS